MKHRRLIRCKAYVQHVEILGIAMQQKEAVIHVNIADGGTGLIVAVRFGNS